MNQTKPWYASISIWGALLAIIAIPAGRLLHTTFTTDQMNTLAALLAQLGDQMQTIGPIVGGIIAWIGRVRATTQIGGSGTPVPPKS